MRGKIEDEGSLEAELRLADTVAAAVPTVGLGIAASTLSFIARAVEES